MLDSQIMGVIREQNLEATAKILVLWLSRQDNAQTFLSKKSIAFECGTHYVTVNYSLKVLISLNIVEIFYMRNERGYRLRTESAGKWVKNIRERYKDRVAIGELAA